VIGAVSPDRRSMISNLAMKSPLTTAPASASQAIKSTLA
jgi:hypothetical protein